MRVAIVGLGKSGTTALFYTIAAAMPRDAVQLFEPKQPPARFEQDPILVKVIANPDLDWSPFRAFEKRIFIARDPRDRLVSFLLYAIYNHPSPIEERDTRRLFELIERKEAASRDVGLWQISEEIERLTGADHRGLLRDRHAAALRLLSEDPLIHRCRYERFVRGDIADLSEYLGLTLSGNVEVAPSVQRVVRTRDSGDWKNWFTPEDIDYFRPTLSAVMEAFGYEDDWEFSESPTIAPAHGSLYLRRLLREQRARSAPWSPWKRARRAAMARLRQRKRW